MNPNELRIGSKVYYNGTHKEVGTVTGVVVYFDGSCLVNLNGRANGLYKIEELSPIPITEEILLKCGFEKVRYEKYAHNKLNKLRAYPHVMKNGFGAYIMGAYTLPNIKYLHQLQNLYFALTGEELNIK